MHAQILGNQINNTILLKHKLERTDKRVENNKLYPVHILSNQMRKKKKYSLFFQRLQEEGKKKKKLSPYEKLRNETVDFFDSLFR